MKKSFSDRLTPGQVQQVFDALDIDWRPLYNPENDGWVNCYHDHFDSDLSINIPHGGWVDQYMAGHLFYETLRLHIVNENLHQTDASR